MAHKLIVNLAPTGMVPTKEHNPALPESPGEIAADCRRCRDLGASIFYIHSREEGRPTHRKELFAAILSEVRAKVPDAILCVTCSGRNVAELAKRAEVLELEGGLRPDMASLTLGSLNFPGQASVNAPETIAGLAARMRERGILPLAVIIKKNTEPLPRPTQFVPDLPAGVENVLLKALHRDPGFRYQHMSEFAAALEQLASRADAKTGAGQETLPTAERGTLSRQ